MNFERFQLLARWQFRVGCYLTLLAGTALAQGPDPVAVTAEQPVLHITYPAGEADFDTRSLYPLELLHLAMTKAGIHFELRASDVLMNQSRAIRMLEARRVIDVLWTMTSIQRERDLLPIRIPINKGLIGWRLLMVRKEQLPALREVTTLSQLIRFPMAQGHDWPDTEILLRQGFQIQTTPDYSALFQMLMKSRVDLLPRALPEIWDEADRYRDEGLVVEPRLMILYRTAQYFFVNANNSELAEMIERGLNRAIADGSFDALFHRYHDPLLKKANIHQRLRFVLTDPFLPPKTPLQRKELWFASDADFSTGQSATIPTPSSPNPVMPK